MKAFKLEGTSMLPLFKAGEVALVASLPRKLHAASGIRYKSPFLPLYKRGKEGDFLPGKGSGSSLRSGDCAVYDHEGRVLLHRVLGTEEKGAWLSDDAGRLAPHFVPWARIQGKVVSPNPLKSGLAGRAYSGLRRLFTRTVGTFSAKSPSSPF